MPRERDAAAEGTSAAATGPGTAGEGGTAARRVGGRRAIDRRVMTVIEGMSDAFLAIGPDWRITYANRQAATLNGTTPEDLVGCDHWARWPETLGTEIERQYRRVTADGVPAQFEHEYVYGETRIWHEVRAFPADDGGLVVFYRDVSAQKALEAERARQARELATAHEKAMAAETQFRLLVDRVRDYAVFLIDPDGIITNWGEGAERMKGWTADEAVGMPLRMLYPGHAAAEDGTPEEHLRLAAERGEYIGEGTRQRKDGTLFHARVVLTALRRGDRLDGFSKITQDLTRERARERSLEAAIESARASNLAKSQFLANTSHEIRTPLNAIIGYAELLEMGLGGPLAGKQAEYLGRIQATSQHLLGLINDVLDLAKIEAGGMQTVREPGAVLDAVTAAMALVEPQARARGLRLLNACGADAPAYRGDAERVRQIVVNLLSNATRFTEPGGRITVSCGTALQVPPQAETRHRGPFTYIRVEDTGAGIPPEQLDRIWDAFVQVDAAPTRKVGGSGLGLTISRHFARLMDGDITVRSQVGLGSSFVLWLPTAEVAPPGRGERTPTGAATVGDAVVEEVSRRGERAMRTISDALLAAAEEIVTRYTARLRADAALPSAAAANETELEDHAVTYVADIAQCLATAAVGDAESRRMLHDGTRIQTVIARRHGVQRARLGWSADEVRRDFALLREEMEAEVRRIGAARRVGDVEPALAAISHFLDHGIVEALAAYRASGVRAHPRDAGEAPPSDEPPDAAPLDAPGGDGGDADAAG